MIMEYFSNLTETELTEFIKRYEETLNSNSTNFDFNGYKVTTTFASYILKYYDY